MESQAIQAASLNSMEYDLIKVTASAVSPSTLRLSQSGRDTVSYFPSTRFDALPRPTCPY